ncbi:MAG: hypothetical protein SV062_07445 [Thermodesulfobacteriota bacterium]|nr:hypothetical protein [Thermodesulfobacteriota bacterium]
MKFLEAKAKLKELAKGRYHLIRYELTEYPTGKLEVKCTVYIDGYSHNSGTTWEEAFNNLQTEMGLFQLDVSEAPDNGDVVEET